MHWIAVLARMFLLLSLSACGNAPGAPWCAHYSTGNNDCSFHSFQQCNASISGVGGVCSPNPRSRYSKRG